MANVVDYGYKTKGSYPAYVSVARKTKLSGSGLITYVANRASYGPRSTRSGSSTTTTLNVDGEDHVGDVEVTWTPF